MGLKWSKPKTVKNDTLVVVSADFPENKNVTKDLWDLWKLKKFELKKDGFGTNKSPITKQFQIVYYHNVNPDVSFEKTTDGKVYWQVEFKNKVKKWATKFEEIQNFKKSTVSNITSDNLDEPNQSHSKKNEFNISDDELENKSTKKSSKNGKSESKSKLKNDEIESGSESEDSDEEFEKLKNKSKSKSHSKSHKSTHHDNHSDDDYEYESNHERDLDELDKILNKTRIK